MLIYLNQVLAEIRELRAAEGRALTCGDLYGAIMEGAVERVRPKMMTVVAIMVACCRPCGAPGPAPRSCSASRCR
jgi:Cu/Ag efflux pump CusA